MKRLLIVSSKSYPSLGGVETVVKRICEDFAGKYDVTLLTNLYRTKSPGFKHLREIKDQSLFDHIRAFCGIGYKTDGYTIKETYFLFFGISTIRSILTVFLFPLLFLHYTFQILLSKPDIINLHFADNAVIYVLLGKILFPKTKLVISLHGSDIKVFSRKSSLHKYLLRESVKKSDRVVSVSKSLLNDYLSIVDENLDMKKTVIINNGISIEMFTNNREVVQNGQILFAGRLVKNKGVDILIRAYRNLKSESRLNLPDLIIAGGGEYMEELIGIAGGDPAIKFLGSYSQDQLKKEFTKSSLFISPSLEDSFGIVNIEAMANFVPVLATNVGGVPEYIKDGYNGVLFRQNDDEDLKSKIAELLMDIGFRRKIAENAYEYAKSNLTAKVQIEKYERVFKEI